MARERQALRVARPGPAAAPWPVRVYLAYEPTVLGVVSVVLVLVVWEGLARGWWADLLAPALGPAAERWRVNPIFLSSPTAVARAAYRLVATGELWRHLGVSALEFAAGFSLAVAVGIPTGLAAGWYRRLRYALEPFLAALNATPRVALLPLVIIWVGIGLASKILIVFLGAAIPICMSALAGVRATDARLLRVARSFGASRRQLFRTVILPGSIPFLLAGLRLGVGRAMVGIVVGELVAATAGIGFLIHESGAAFRTDRVFVGIVVIALAGALLTEALAALERRVERWRPKVGAG